MMVRLRRRRFKRGFSLPDPPFLCQSLDMNTLSSLAWAVSLAKGNCATPATPSVLFLSPYSSLLVPCFNSGHTSDWVKTLAPWIRRDWGRMEHAQRLGHSKPCPVRNSQKNSRRVTEAYKSWLQKTGSPLRDSKDLSLS